VKSEVEERVNFNLIRYSQCWEDADLLLEAIDIKDGEVALSIASAGDNSFSMLTKNPSKVFGIDINFSQIACCELRKSMYKNLEHEEFLTFGGMIDGEMDRIEIFNRRVKDSLPQGVRLYWEDHLHLISKGFMTQGKFEKYFEKFRTRALYLVHGKKHIDELIQSKSFQDRQEFYEKIWNNKRWKWMFQIFFSRFVMGRLGRDKEFFKYVKGSVAERILNRAKHALTVLDPSKNPYLQFILLGEYKDVLPHALRKENYDSIRERIDKIEFKKQSIEEFISQFRGRINVFNLSDIFEYMTQENMDDLYEVLLKSAEKDARIAYWNMLVPRSASPKFNIITDEDRNRELLLQDKAFFYSRFYVDRVI
jgi:S-adenosylmethionine-diacylglycerol 3-amino-3-carboxypropyl transferase